MSLWSTFKSTLKPWQTTHARSSDTSYPLTPPSLSKHSPCINNLSQMPLFAFLKKFKGGTPAFVTLALVIGFFLIGSATGGNVSALVNKSVTGADVCKWL